MWRIINHHHLLSFGVFSLLLSVLFSFGICSNSFAVDDISASFSSGDSFTIDTPIFSNCDSSCLSQFHYLIVSFSSDNSFSLSVKFNYIYYVRSTNNLPRSVSFIVLSFPSDSGLNSINFGNSSTFGSNVTFTLTENYKSCPEQEPCPVIPDNPYDDKFDNITRAIYVCGAILLVLYFFYCIYKLLIGGARR